MIPKFRAWDKLTDTVQDVLDINFLEKTVTVSQKDIVWYKHDNLRPFKGVILMQSTGLKDLKGVEIFEGDVVWIIDKGEMDNGWGWFEEVKFRNGSFMAGDDFLVNSHHRCVVHGNIYEQPELLGGASMNNRHRRIARLEARQLLAEIASLISRRYGVTAEESARQIQVMIKTNSISFETLEELNR
ncbi:YopX family protein [Enterococcus diestrammenae]|uniref:YopX family protein n=1 Tax=Enterococcus diestrammenae TaxID=1155073 RepID=UPI0022E0634E|nr:YopX family protein [Enterococcus diestrammenae]